MIGTIPLVTHLTHTQIINRTNARVDMSITAWLFGSPNVYCRFLPARASYHYTGGARVDGNMVS